MAKESAAVKNNDKPKTEEVATKPQDSGLPQGYLSTAADAVGFFDADYRADGNEKGLGYGESIHGVPLHVILTDSTIDKAKPSALIFIRLIDPCKAVRDGSGEGDVSKRPLIDTKRGDVVGVWFSAGMRDLAHLGGAKVFMRQEPEEKWKKIKGKPSKMKTFQIANSPDRKGEKLEVKEDRRNESAGVEARPFCGVKLSGRKPTDTGDAGDGGDDDIPF